MLQEAADELCAVDGDDALAAFVVAAHAQVHVALVDGHAMGVAAQVVQHHLGAGGRSLGVDDPVVAQQRVQSSLLGFSGVLAGSTGCVRAAKPRNTIVSIMRWRSSCGPSTGLGSACDDPPAAA